MKKIIFIIIALVIVIYVSNDKKEDIKIPDSAIRFRILANSNSPRDQKLKEDIKEKIQKELYMVLHDSKNITEARRLINNNMDNFDNILKENMKDEPYSYEMDFGMHYFPSKTYKGITYDEGYYESLLVTLGEGAGDNWWCVLFPPLCVLEAEENTSNEVEYKFFIKELIEKYF